MKKISVNLSNIGKLIKALDEYERNMNQKAQLLCTKLAEEGYRIAKYTFDSAHYDGKKDVSVYVEPRGELKRAVVAVGSTVLILEFGAGYLLGYGHPEPMEYGPGTYPGQKHAFDPNGWYLPKEVQEATGIEKSIGNAPSMAMYKAVKELEQNIQRIASEVFND